MFLERTAAKAAEVPGMEDFRVTFDLDDPIVPGGQINFDMFGQGMATEEPVQESEARETGESETEGTP
jgi:hypothetical protein